MTCFLVVGPPAVGKSTVTRLLAEARPQSVLVDVDRIRDTMVVSGAVLPGPEWSDALVRQLSASRQSACAIARAYDAIGFDVVIDDFWDPGHLADYALIDDLRPRRIVLLPPREVALARNAGRGRGGDFIEEGIAEVYAYLPPADAMAAAGWTVLDNDGEPAAATRDRILALA